MANAIFVYWSNGLGAGRLTIIVGTRGGAFANKNCPQGQAFDIFFSSARGLPGRGCSRLELTRTLLCAEIVKLIPPFQSTLFDLLPNQLNCLF